MICLIKIGKIAKGSVFWANLNLMILLNIHVGEKMGDMIEFETGKKLGNHKGFWFHTIGQRQGSGLSRRAMVRGGQRSDC